MKITKDTRVSAILEEYGDIADVMEVFGVKRVARYSLRWLAAKAVTVEWAARIHRVPLAEFLKPWITRLPKNRSRKKDNHEDIPE